MTEEQATKLLRENEWCTFSDARELLLEAAAIGAKETMESIEPELRRLHAENEALKAELAKSRTPLTDSEWLEYILRNGSKSDVHIATYEGVATTGAHGMVIRLQHDANNLRKLVESAHGIQA